SPRAAAGYGEYMPSWPNRTDLAGLSVCAAKNGAARVARDHQFFVRSHDFHDASAFRGADHVFGSVVSSRIDAYAEMAKIAADLLAKGWRMFADAASKH